MAYSFVCFAFPFPREVAYGAYKALRFCVPKLTFVCFLSALLDEVSQIPLRIALRSIKPCPPNNFRYVIVDQNFEAIVVVLDVRSQVW